MIAESMRNSLQHGTYSITCTGDDGATARRVRASLASTRSVRLLYPRLAA